MPSFAHSKDVIGTQNLKNGHVTLTTPFQVCFVIHGLFAKVNLPSKLEVSFPSVTKT